MVTGSDFQLSPQNPKEPGLYGYVNVTIIQSDHNYKYAN